MPAAIRSHFIRQLFRFLQIPERPPQATQEATSAASFR
jgi:hypothetical protein